MAAFSVVARAHARGMEGFGFGFVLESEGRRSGLRVRSGVDGVRRFQVLGAFVMVCSESVSTGPGIFPRQ